MPKAGAIHVGRNHPIATVTAEAVIADAISGKSGNFSRSGSKSSSAFNLSVTQAPSNFLNQ